MGSSGFSAAGRDEAWSSLGEEVFDLLIIGGGITGAGVARDAAGRGFRVALVEQGDIGSGTSSLSSRLIHGGLRYLETFDFDLVFEALRERRRLLELAPHLVHPLPFLFPVFRGDPTGRLKLAAGMWLYETLSLFQSPRRHRMLSREGVLETEPLLRKDGLSGGAIYYDAQVDDARLTLAVARGAADAGATVLSYARAVGVRRGSGETAVVEVEDGLRPRRLEVEARVVLNATGPWSDRTRQIADGSVETRLRATKGVHIVVDRGRVGNHGAIIFRSAVDGRVMFVLPWGDLTYIGTTDTEYAGDPGAVRAESADVEYLLESANAIFPAAKLVQADVRSTWAGVRPLLAPEPGHGLSESQTSREHAIWRDESGLLNVAGGKLTTFRSMAAETVEVIAQILEEEFEIPSGAYYTEFLPLPGSPEGEWEAAADRLENDVVDKGIDRVTAAALVRRYGDDVRGVIALTTFDPSLALPLIPGRPYLRAEVPYVVRGELALTLEDVLRRRLHLFYEEFDGARDVAREVAELMAPENGIGWSAAQIEEQVAAYGAAVAATRSARSPKSKS